MTTSGTSKFSEESDIDSPRESPTLGNEQTTNFGHNGIRENSNSFVGSKNTMFSSQVEVVPIIQVDDLLKNSVYLTEYENWSTFIKDTRNFTSSMIKKQNMIWELVNGERTYLQHLYRLKRLYKDKIPMSIPEKEQLFPNLERMIELHARLFKFLSRKHQDCEGTVQTGIGGVFREQLDPQTKEIFQQIYGKFSYAYSESLRDLAKRIQSDPGNHKFFSSVQKSDPDYKKGIDGYLLIINQRWTKVEPLLASIADATIENYEEKSEIEMARDLAGSILSGAQSYMMVLKNEDLLRKLKSHFKYRSEMNVSSAFRDAESWISEELNSNDLHLKNFDKLSVVQKGKYHKGYGVAINTGFFILSEGATPDTYNLMKIEESDGPIIVKWGIDKSIFREVAGHPLQFFLVLHPDCQPSIHEIHCATQDECQRWKEIISKGLQQCKINGNTIEEAYKRDRNRAEEEYLRNMDELQRLNELDEELIAAINSRNSFLQTFFNKDFMKTMQDLSINRKSSNNVERTSSGSSTKSNTSKTKPPQPNEQTSLYSGNNSRSNSSLVELRRKTLNDDLDELQFYCIDLVRFIQNRKPSSISRSCSNVEERDSTRGEGKSKSKIGNPVSIFRSGSREKPMTDGDSSLLPDDKVDEATFKDRLLHYSKKINDKATIMSNEFIRLQQQVLLINNNLAHLRRDNDILSNFRMKILKNITCEKCKRDLESSDPMEVENSKILVHSNSNNSSMFRLAEFEKLRTMRDEFEKQKAESMKENERMKASLERDKQRLMEEKDFIAKREEKLKQAQDQLDEDRRILQLQIDFYSNGRPSVSSYNEPEGNYPLGNYSISSKSSFSINNKADKFYTEKELDSLNDYEYTDRIKQITGISNDNLKFSRLNQSTSRGQADFKPTVPSHLAKQTKKHKK